MQRAAAFLAALEQPRRRTLPIFISHRLRNGQIRQTKKSTSPASERGSRPWFTPVAPLAKKADATPADGVGSPMITASRTVADVASRTPEFDTKVT